MREAIAFFKAKIYNAFKRNHQMEFLFLMGMKKRDLKLKHKQAAMTKGFEKNSLTC